MLRCIYNFAIISSMAKCGNRLFVKQSRQGIGVLFLALIVFFCVHPRCASAFRTIQLDQDRVRIMVKPGTTYTGRIEVKNPSDEPRQVKAYLQDWVYSDDQGSKEILPLGSKATSCANWISIVPQEFTVPAFGKRAINYSVSIPSDAHGGYYAVLFCESSLGSVEAQELQNESTAAVVPISVRIGFLFFVEIKDTATRDVAIENFAIEKTGTGYAMSINYQNIGTVDIKANGTFNIMDQRGVVCARGRFDDNYSLPGDHALLRSRWSNALDKGTYDVVVTLDLGRSLEDYGLGRGPIKVKEGVLEIGENGEVVQVQGLR
ncbi:MAG: hypothetical protein KBA46_06055 [Candidatus Omnitrophica bacterium]|nr:hypothetical protein [Candidatus Omnitrophota bacterium]